MTWAEFKKKLEDEGVTDDMEIWYIDMSFDSELVIDVSNDLGFTVY